MEVVNQKTNIKIYWKIFRGENKVTEDFHRMNTELKVFVVGTGNKYYMVPIINRDIEAGYDVIEIDIPARMLETGAYDLRAIWWKNKGRNLLTSNRCGIFGITDSAEEAPIEDLAVIKIASYTESFGRDGMSAYETAVMYDLHLGITSEKEWVMQETIRNQNENARKAAEEERKSNEASRVSEETKRVTAETARKYAEDARKYAEDARVYQEATRKTSEEARNNAENARKASETTRVEQEYARINSENNRAKSENTRVSNENNRVEAEKKRVANETSREAAEDNREARFTQNEKNRTNRFNTAETARNANETSRVAAEGKRVVAESNRASNESTRVSNENQRIANENARKAAEEERQATYQSKLGKEDIVQTTGSSTDKVMSQKAVTDALKKAGGGGGSSVTIVNNLTEGGKDKALSAEMGKTLSERIEEVAENGGGVPIVDSVDKLDPNAPQGSLASVAINTGGEVLFSELYQPTSDEVNEGTGVVDTTNLSSVSGISINSSFDTSAEIKEFLIYLFSKDIDMQGGVGQVIGLFSGSAMIMSVSTQETNELELFTTNEDGTVTVNEENLVVINNLLSSTEFVYGGFNGDPSYVDMFYKSINGAQKTDLYIKDVEGWKLYKNTLSIPRIGIVNDLTTGGTDTALSAEMGKVLSEKISPLDSTSKLSDNDPIGTLRTVAFANEFSSSNFVEPSSFVSKVDRVWEINFRENPYSPVAQKFSSWSLRNKLGSYISISINRPSKPGDLYDITYSENYGASKTLCGYSINSGINSIDYDNLASLNELLKNGEYFSDYISGAVSLGGGVYRYGVDELLTAAKDAEIYNWKSLACLRTSGGWSTFPKVVNNLSDGGSTEPLSAEMGKELSETISELPNKVNVVVDSVDWLSEDAEVGSMAFVLDAQEGKVPLTVSYKNGQLLRNINIYAPEKSDIIATERITMTFQTYVSNAGGYIPLSIIIGPPPASFNSNVEWGLFVDIQRAMEGKMTLASYDSEGNRTAFNQSAVDRLISELSDYYYVPNGTISEEDEDTINSFFSVNGEISIPILFTKNTLKWEEYDKATKDKVATLETKVAELEAKIQELLQN